MYFRKIHFRKEQLFHTIVINVPYSYTTDLQTS